MPINLGQITFGIGADTTRLRGSIQDITNFGSAVTAAATNANTAGTAVESAFRKQEAAMISALQKVQRYQDAVGRLQAPTAITQGLNQLSTRGLDLLVQRMSSGQLTALQFQREMERFNQTLTNSQRIMTNFAAAQKQAEQSGMVASLQKLSSAAILVAGPLSGVATRISVVAGLAEHFSLAWAGAIAGVAAGAFAFYKVSTAIITTEKSLQGIENTLQAVYGNITIANLQMSYLADLSQKSGLSIAVLGKQFGQFEAAAKGTSLEGERARKIFESITFATQKLGLSSEETEGALKAVQQMMSKGVVAAEELKGQLGDRLPGAVKIMADSLGVTTMKLAEMMKKGEVTASSLVGFADKLRERYNVDTAQKLDTIVAAEGRLATARATALDSLDKIVGVSQAYKNVLNYVADGLTGASSNSREFVKQLTMVGVALTAAFAAPLIIGGISSITFGIAGLTRGIWALNAATATGAFSSFVKLLATASIAIAAYYGSEQLIDKALAKTTESYLKAKPAAEDYINAQKNLITSVRQPTRDYIADQEKLLAAQEAQRNDLAAQASAMLGWADTLEKSGLTAEQVETQLKKTFGDKNLGAGIEVLNAKIAATKKNLEDLNAILKKQDEIENKPRPDPEKEMTNRVKTTIDKAKESIRDLKAQYDTLNMAPAAKEYAEVQNEINHKIETFKENLERAEVPAKKIKDLVTEYGDSLRKLKEGELIFKNHMSAFQAAADIVGRGMNTGLTNLVDVLVDGKDKFLALADTAKAVAKDILNTFLKLAALNPLKNLLLGTNEQTLGGNGGIGGLIGNLINGSGSGSAMTMSGTGLGAGTGGLSFPMFAKGGVMTSMGEVPLRKYAGGGIANSPQMAMFGEGSRPEAYVPLPDGRSIPVSMSGGAGGGGNKVQVNIINQSKDTTASHKNYQSGDVDVHDIIIQSVSKGFIEGDFAGVTGRRTKRR